MKRNWASFGLHRPFHSRNIPALFTVPGIAFEGNKGSIGRSGSQILLTATAHKYCIIPHNTYKYVSCGCVLHGKEVALH